MSEWPGRRDSVGHHTEEWCVICSISRLGCCRAAEIDLYGVSLWFADETRVQQSAAVSVECVHERGTGLALTAEAGTEVVLCWQSTTLELSAVRFRLHLEWRLWLLFFNVLLSLPLGHCCTTLSGILRVFLFVCLCVCLFLRKKIIIISYTNKNNHKSCTFTGDKRYGPVMFRWKFISKNT